MGVPPKLTVVAYNARARRHLNAQVAVSDVTVSEKCATPPS